VEDTEINSNHMIHASNTRVLLLKEVILSINVKNI